MTGDFGPDASLLGRVWDPAAPGPCVVTLRGDVLVDISTRDAPTVRDLLEADNPAEQRGIRSEVASHVPPFVLGAG